MNDMEYRGNIRITGLDVESDEAERLLSSLDRLHGNLGPVLSGERDGLDVILATDQDDRAQAASVLFGATVDALLDAGLYGLYPSAIELEVVDDLVPA